MEESKNSYEKFDDVAEEEDSEQPTVVVYYTEKKMYNLTMRYLLNKRTHNLKLPDYN
ncbi:hypothetical protein GIB67_037079 [Kingdonia uniflora]|uniref:Uncharacterized protein n=1 Tax=Kingdonia uniflora TaxID=39325 RepID=A0A7J7LHL9_9MAGN|nr:hypothetical protein GIB67_037079 [Kingdonia uniflora]